MDDLRNKLDAASLLPRGRWKDLFLAAAEEFAKPAVELVERTITTHTTHGSEDAGRWLADPQGPMPLADCAAWEHAFKPLGALERKDLLTLVKRLVAAVKLEPDTARVVPLLLAPLRESHWQIASALGRARWLATSPLGAAAGVACLVLPAARDFADKAFTQLSWLEALPTEARGAMWLRTWSSPDRLEFDWRDHARLHEPAAVAAILGEALSAVRLPLRPATTKALCRIIRREDPWLEPRWAKDDFGEGPLGEKVLPRALALLPALARATDTLELARETLDTRWSELGVDGALARAQFGGADCVPALIEALTGSRAVDVLRALTALGRQAREAVSSVQALPEQRWKTVTLAALDPSSVTLETLCTVCDDVALRAPEVREQYVEGLITADEYAEQLEPATEAARLWDVHGWSDGARRAWARVVAACVGLPDDEHPVFARLRAGSER